MSENTVDMRVCCANCNKEYPLGISRAREIIIQQMGMATRWTAVDDCISAWLHVNLQARMLREEHELHFCRSTRSTGTNKEASDDE